MNETDRRIAFWNAYLETTAEHPLCRHFRVWQNCIVLEVSIWNGSVRLSGIQSLYPGQGHASRCLRWLLALAQEHTLPVTGTAKKFGTVPAYLNTLQLRAWYRRYGAKINRRGEMTFTPKPL